MDHLTLISFLLIQDQGEGEEHHHLREAVTQLLKEVLVKSNLDLDEIGPFCEEASCQLSKLDLALLLHGLEVDPVIELILSD